MGNAKKRFYIASKVGVMDEIVNAVRDELVRRGYEEIYDWRQNVIEKPFEDHPDQVEKAAEKMAYGVMHCDILIVLTAAGGIGYHIEMGGAFIASIILHFITGQKPQVEKRIFVVGKDNNRSVFYFHPLVTRLPNVATLLEHLPPVES